MSARASRLDLFVADRVVTWNTSKDPQIWLVFRLTLSPTIETCGRFSEAEIGPRNRKAGL